MGLDTMQSKFHIIHQLQGQLLSQRKGDFKIGE